MRHKIIALIAAFSACATTAFASEAPAAVVDTVTRISHGHAHILRAFQGPMGLDGLALELSPGHDVIAYASKDGRYLFIGGLFDANGSNIAKNAAETYLPRPPGAGQLLHDAARAHAYLWGMESAGKELWAVFDPDCLYCHMLFEALRPAVERGELKVHVIQVAFLKAGGIGRATAIIGAADPATALVWDETRFDSAAEQGGIKADVSNKAALAMVRANNAWMQGHGIRSTPYLLYRDRDGLPRTMPGFPRNITALLSELERRP